MWCQCLPFMIRPPVANVEIDHLSLAIFWCLNRSTTYVTLKPIIVGKSFLGTNPIIFYRKLRLRLF